MSTVLVASVIATKWRNGGNARAVLNWVHGLKRLGVRTFYVEQIAPRSCTDEQGHTVPFERSANVAYFEHVMREVGGLVSAELAAYRRAVYDDHLGWPIIV